MSEVWIEHPDLGPGSREKVLRASLGSYVGLRGYQVCAVQSDPVPAEEADALAADEAHPDVVEHDEHETPADVEPVHNDDPEES